MDEAHTVIVRGGMIVTGNGAPPAIADVLVRDGVVAAITAPDVLPRESNEIDASGLVVLPGMIDPHVHFGISASVEADFASESRAAARGGVTTVLSFNKTMSSYHDVVPSWIEEASRASIVDFAFHLGLFTPQHVAELDEYIDRYGVTSFKFFMSYRGVEKSKFGIDVALDDAFLFDLMRRFGSHPRRPRLSVHCENMELVRAASGDLGRRVETLRDWHVVRSGWSEADAVQRVVMYAEATNANVYIVHVSSRQAASYAVRASAWLDGDQVVFESCPHYLTLDVDEAGERVGTLAKVNPPVRTTDDAEALWDAIRAHVVTSIGSDHVPRPHAVKVGDGSFASATAGFPGLEVTLPLLLTFGPRHGIGLNDVVALTATNPARAFGVGATKGRIAIGYDADLVLVDLDETRVVRGDAMISSSGYSPYEGMNLRGWPRSTLVRGVPVMVDGAVQDLPGHGRYVRKGGASAI